MRKCPYCAEKIQDEAVRCRFCGAEVPIMAARPGQRTDLDVAGLAVRAGLVVGGLLIAAAPALPWISVLVLESSLFGLGELAARFGAVPHAQFAAVAFVVTGVLGVVAGVSLRPRRWLRAAAVVVGAEAGVMAAVLLLMFLSGVSHSNGLAGVGLGPWVAVTGAVVTVAGAIVPARASLPSPPPGRMQQSAAIGLIVVALIPLGLFTTSMVELGRVAERSPLADSRLPDFGSPLAPAAPAPVTIPSTPTAQPSTVESATPTPALPQRETAATSELSDAENLVLSKGYTPAENTQWPTASGLNVILGRLTVSGDGYDQRAFFFNDGRYLGLDASAASAGIREAWSTGDTIALQYAVYGPTDPMCCPSGSAQVRYHWTGSSLVPLDPIPPTDAVPGSRR